MLIFNNEKVIGDLNASGERFVAVCEDPDTMVYIQEHDMLGATVTVSTDERGRGGFVLGAAEAGAKL